MYNIENASCLKIHYEYSKHKNLDRCLTYKKTCNNMDIDLRSPYSTKLKQTVCKKESEIKYSRAD